MTQDNFERRGARIDHLVATATEARRMFVDVVTDDIDFVTDGDHVQVALNCKAMPGVAVAPMLGLRPTRGCHSQLAGGDTSVLGLAHAVSAEAQVCVDGGRQSELEQQFWAIVGDVDTYATAATP